MPDGDPEALELMAARLEVAAAGVADLGNSTRQVTGSIRPARTGLGTPPTRLRLSLRT